jgi:hypothetical protein
MKKQSNVRHLSFTALAAALALGILTPGSSAADDSSGNGWERLRTEDGIIVSRKDVPGSAFVAFRGEGDVNAPLLAVGSVLVDVPHEKDWIDSVEDARVVRQISETEYVVYSHVGTPVTMSDRDFVADVRLIFDASQKSLTIRMHSVTDPKAPPTDYVRGELKDSSFILTSTDNGNKTHVVAEIHCDPKGSIAGWIVNLFQKSWGYNTLRSLRRQVAKPEVAIHPRLKAMLEDKGYFTASPP